MTRIDRELRADDLGAFEVAVEFDPAWAIGSSMFGGAVAGGCVRACLTALKRDDLVPASSSLRFLGPTAPGPATITVRVIRSGLAYATALCDVRHGRRTTASALLTLAPRASIPLETGAWDEDPTGLPSTTASGVEPEGGAVADRVEWRSATDWLAGERVEGEFCSWFRLRDTDAPALDPTRYLLAADLIGPAVAADGLPLPFRIATVSLDVTTVRLTDSPWLQQRIRVHRTGRDAVAELRLFSPAGAVVATAIQRAVVLPATDDELPFAVTGFGKGRR